MTNWGAHGAQSGDRDARPRNFKSDPITNDELAAGSVANTNFASSALATQAQQETGTATNVAVTPATQQHHPSALKVWCLATAAGVATVSYNVDDIDDNGTGDLDVNFTVSFSTSNYAVTATCLDASGVRFSCVLSRDAGFVQILNTDETDSAADATGTHMMAAGDQ